jgi:hypothetical protein
MTAGAYQKCEKNGTRAEEWATSVERSKGHPAAALLENGTQLCPSAQCHCGPAGGSRDLESYSTPSTGGHCRHVVDPFGAGASVSRKRLLIKLAEIDR